MWSSCTVVGGLFDGSYCQYSFVFGIFIANMLLSSFKSYDLDEFETDISASFFLILDYPWMADHSFWGSGNCRQIINGQLERSGRVIYLLSLIIASIQSVFPLTLYIQIR